MVVAVVCRRYAMLLTHLPSGLLLGPILTAGNFQLAILLFISRAGTHEMDQAPRQAFISSIVLTTDFFHYHLRASGLSFL
ncbi:hypothetical protein V1515DRAFT_610760, partial [Lipomyces mesembrius]